MHDAGARRADLDAPELVFSSNAASVEFGAPARDVAKLLERLGSQILAGLPHLPLGLAYAALDLCDLRRLLDAWPGRSLKRFLACPTAPFGLSDGKDGRRRDTLPPGRPTSTPRALTLEFR
jgi:hypothetical protein